ncbi:MULTISPECIES: diaminopimelate epimerase [Caproicibacterium]|jgi:diaminopimelate epimerase|uniref:Diaminopimelate epimerase n=1 Tax=Caproicibacterium lactatifermentans TaxID=2666138 RepID=A0A859DRR6_9FIRM|nr:diaminopimelate epimerase [Caproicibacterium lactatifermentans]ARP50122.1 diaminopimelate epimerase [Ruminococcaceae bacterium CPB6]MDD4808009.1 diaminopimelate epimerase [Oscillospiraceae bacterium]QKN24155.1 diaminopimelate epimerase [Caproicibacterium lactatifermentans]QKO30777.1 diaminopimelate epimerase [Caproicibacterium lactatifermentans]
MKFTKMQGIGNDYIYVNCFEEQVTDPGKLSIRLSDRHFGIGSDGVILIKPSKTADCEMDMYNADGSRGKMCGNGIRCVGKYVYDRGICRKNPLRVDTQSGIKTLYLQVENGAVQSVRVDMGAPVLEPENIPVQLPGSHAVNVPYSVAGKEQHITCVSMGNPHCVLFVPDTDSLDLEKIGPNFENAPIFPERVNTEFIQLISRTEIKMRVWERGSGETLACGTGACASVVACVLNDKTERRVRLHLLGGDLVVTWDEKTGHVFLEGPAAFVFDGTVEV